MTELTKKLPDDINLHYAIKANPLPMLVDHMASIVHGLDVASHQELLLALASGMPVERISFAGPAKSPLELKAALYAGVLINVESATELGRLSRFSKEAGIRAQIALRINPDFELKTSGMKMSGGSKPFGIDQEMIPGVIAAIDRKHINLKGFHVFCGSQNLDSTSIVEAHNKTFLLIERLAELVPELQQINIGGGFGIPYFPGEKSLDEQQVCDNLKRLMAERKGKLAQCRVVMELGGIWWERVVIICAELPTEKSPGGGHS